MAERQSVYAEVAPLAAHHGTRLFLSDHRAAQIELSTVELYSLPEITGKFLAEHGVPPYRWKRALVANRQTEKFEFLEDVSLNRGHLLRIFYDYAAAKEWLLGPDEAKLGAPRFPEPGEKS